MRDDLMQSLHFVKGLDPVADAFAGTVYSDVVKMDNYQSCAFVVYAGVGASGTSTFTVSACPDATPSTRTAIPFKYREITTGDTEGAITNATTSGWLGTAGSSKLFVIEVDRADVAAANSNAGYEYVELKAVEGTDSPVLGGVLVIMGNGRYESSIKPTAIV